MLGQVKGHNCQTDYQKHAKWQNVKVQIDKLKLWKVDELRKFCRSRGLPATFRCKEELISLVFTALVQKLPCVLSKEEEADITKTDYKSLCEQVKVPDPYELSDGWESELDGLSKWPPCMYEDISIFLQAKGKVDLLERLRNDYNYKEGRPS